MSEKEIWDGSALTEADKTITKVKYEGNEITANHFICGTSTSSIPLLKSITKDIKPIGWLVLDVYDILNLTQYANGSEAELKHIRQLKNNVYLLKDVCITIFEHFDNCQHELIKLFYDTFKPNDLIILNSIHQSLFYGRTEIPSLYVLSNSGENPKFPLPNIVCGFAAGFLDYSLVYKVKCKILEVVEEDFGANAASFGLWAEKLKELIPFEVSNVTSQAVKLNNLRQNDIGLVYT